MKKIIILSLIFLVLLFPNVTNASDEYIQTSTKVLTELLDRTFDEFKNPVSLNTDDLVVKNKDSEMYLAHMDFNLNYLKLYDIFWKDYEYSLDFDKFENGYLYFNSSVKYNEKDSSQTYYDSNATYKIKVENIKGKNLITHIESTGFMFEVFEMIYNEKLKENPNLTVDEYLTIRKNDSKEVKEVMKKLEKNNASKFTDVNNHWSKKFIDWSADNNLIYGYDDGEFKPNSNITRGEFITLVNRLSEDTSKVETISFTDLDEKNWYYEEVKKALGFGYIEDGTHFRGDEYITRDEASQIFYKFLNGNKMSKIMDFKDESEIRFLDEVIFLTRKDIINGYPDGYFRPKNPITRGETCKILFFVNENKKKL